MPGRRLLLHDDAVCNRRRLGARIKAARFEFAVAVSPSIDVKDFAQLVAWIKANPAKASYGVPSSGTIPHFTGWQLEQLLGLSATRVSYRGSAPIINDLIGGHLPFAVTTLSDLITQHRQPV